MGPHKVTGPERGWKTIYWNYLELEDKDRKGFLCYKRKKKNLYLYEKKKTSSSECKFAASHRPTPIVGPLRRQVRVGQKCRQEEQTWCFQVLWNWDLCPAVLQMQAASIFAASLPVALECQPRSERPGLMALQIAKLGFLSQYIWGQAWELPARLLTLMWQDTGPQLEGMTAALWQQVCSVATLKWNIRYPSDETQRKQWLNCDLYIYIISSRAGDVASWVTVYQTCTRTWVPSPQTTKK